MGCRRETMVINFDFPLGQSAFFPAVSAVSALRLLAYGGGLCGGCLFTCTFSFAQPKEKATKKKGGHLNLAGCRLASVAAAAW